MPNLGRTTYTDVGFVFFEVYSSTLMINARYVEKALQYNDISPGSLVDKCGESFAAVRHVDQVCSLSRLFQR